MLLHEIVIEATSKVAKIPADVLLGTVRTADIVRWRAVIELLMRELGYTLIEVGKLVGRNHSSVEHVIRSYADDPICAAMCSAVKEYVRSNYKQKVWE